MLVDTQSFIWFVENSSHLPLKVKIMMEQSVKLTLSIVNLWKITIKVSLGKLAVSGDIAIAENIPIVSCDNVFHLYPVNLIWQ